MKVFLHGWGMRKEMFSSYIEAHHCHEDVMCLSLPGYDSECITQNFDKQVTILSKQIPGDSHVVGWSLGGLYALRLAQHFPNKVSGITLICSSPLFVKKKDWVYGLDRDVLAQFGDGLVFDRNKITTQFMLLQLYGQKNIKLLIKKFKEELINYPQPSLLTLQTGLSYLLKVDLREELKSMETSVCFVFGGKDRIVLADQMSELSGMGSHIKVHLIKDAGHMPFITHMSELAAVL